jgi:hypothetical protein
MRSWTLLAFSFSVACLGDAVADSRPPAKQVSASLEARLVEADQEILAFRLADGLGLGGLASVDVAQPAGRPRPWSALIGNDGPKDLVLIRRQIPPAGEAQTVTIGGPSNARKPESSSRWQFTIGDTSGAKVDPGLKRKWLQSLRLGLTEIAGPWSDFARKRLQEMENELGLKEKKGTRAARVGVAQTRARPDPSSLVALMDSTSGATSIHEALQTDRQLRTRFAGEAPSVALATLEPPAVADHPWKEMLAALGKKVPDEPLAHAAPANFYYVRFASLSHLFRLLDEADAWVTPVASMSSGVSQNQDLGKRYETQLGLGRSQVSRVFGPQVVIDVAVVGSDPYLREGSDLTFVFRTKNQAAFQAGLDGALAGHVEAHGKQTRQTIDVAGEKVTVTRSEDSEVRQHRVDVGGYSLVSNSLGGIKAVIETIQGHRAALADALDFRYMAARDADVPADVLAFMSDAFVADVVGPRQKILETRRLLALSDLATPGYAALVYGWMFGKAPSSAQDLVAAGLLGKDELRHATGETIAWTSGKAASSSWGKVASLTPLIDLPVLEKVSTSERDAYRLFASSYQSNWSTYMDPACLRLTMDAAGKHGIRADLRILPIIESSDYRKMQQTVGEARIDDPARAGGLQFSLGVGPQAELRKLVTDMARELPSALRAQLDWLGEVAFVGVEDRFPAKPVLSYFDDKAHPRDRDIPKLFTEAPIWAGVGVRSRLAATVTLSTIRKMVMDAAPGALEWREHGNHKGVPYVVVRAGREGDARQLAGDLALYYAFCNDYLLLSLSESALKSRIDDCKGGRLAKGAGQGTAGGRQAAQLVFSLATKPGGPFWQLMSAGLAVALDEAQRGSLNMATVLARGAPDLDGPALRHLALAYVGNVPVDADGGEPLAKPETARTRILDDYRTKVRPEPAQESSPAGRLATAFARARSDIAFDDEPTPKSSTESLRSLHIVLSVGGP